MRDIDLIVIHCADTPPDMDIGAEEIRDWHLARGWRDIGYHYVIRRDGTVENGRPVSEAGAHARGHNANSIGVCLVGGKGGCNFTRHQWKSLGGLVEALEQRHRGAKVTGHRDLDSGKQCPTFDAEAWWNEDVEA